MYKNINNLVIFKRKYAMSIYSYVYNSSIDKMFLITTYCLQMLAYP